MEFELTQKVSKRSGDRSVKEILDSEGKLWSDNGNEQTGAAHKNRKSTARHRNKQGERKRRAGRGEKLRKAVFSIEFEHFTAEQNRSRYDGDTKNNFYKLRSSPNR